MKKLSVINKVFIFLSVILLAFIFSAWPSQAAGPGICTTVETLPATDPLPGVTNAAELQSYLNEHYSTVSTSFKTYDLKGYITVLENADALKCYDIAINIPWTVIGYAEIQQSMSYTAEQKEELRTALQTYQKNIASVSIATFPTKKIRGGFLTAGYRYPNLQSGYYELFTNGWKNYKYQKMYINTYKDTTVDVFNWHEFNENGNPGDWL